MNITIETAAAEDCKPSYVDSCSPPPEPLPKCEDGWEFSNTGTAVCSTPDEPLALTGGDMSDINGPLIIGIVLLGAAAISISIAKFGTRRRKIDK